MQLFYVNFIDFEKAFDNVHRQGLWAIVKSYGIPDKITTLAFYSCSTGPKSTCTIQMFHGAENWKMYKKENKMLDTFQNRCLRRIVGVWWPEHISNGEICKRSGVPPVSKEVKTRRCRWLGHVLRMQPGDDPRAALSGLPMGRRHVGRPRTTWRRMAETERSHELGWKSWEEARQVAVNRSEWRRIAEALFATWAQIG